MASGTTKDVACAMGLSRTYLKTSPTSQDHDCTLPVKGCNLSSPNAMRSPYRAKASCFACYGGQAVVLTNTAVAVAKAETLKQYLQDQSLASFPSTFCASLTALGVEVANCGAYLLTEENGLAKFQCVECRPTYKRAAGDSGLTVSACSAIDKCVQARMGDVCEQCDWSQGYALASDQLSCAKPASPPANCLQLAADGQACQLCRPGFFLSLQAQCQLIKAADCLARRGNECAECRNPLDVALHDRGLRPQAPLTCSPRDGQSAALPAKCLMSDAGNRCVKCEDGFQPNAHGQCFGASTIPNCQVYDPTTEGCFRCQPGYWYEPLSRQCLSNAPSAGQSCSVSFPAPVPTNGGLSARCSNARIDSCRLLGTGLLSAEGKLACLQCEPGYRLQAVEPAQQRCAALEPLPNCQKHYADGQLNFRCQSCSGGYYVGAFGQCQPRGSVPQCQAYQENSEDCTLCGAGYYVKDGACAQRQVLYGNCEQYFANADDCQAFSTLMQYFGRYGTVQLSSPPASPAADAPAESEFKGVLNCAKYAYPTLCARCGGATFLDAQANLCRPVQRVVLNCLVYDSASSCGQCEEGYVYYGGLCAKVSAKNCLVFASPSACASCPAASPVLDPSGSCVNDPSLHCLAFAQFPACQLCESGYYLVGQACAKVDKPAPNCQQYGEGQRCAACQPGFYVTLEGGCAANPGFDPNCGSFAYSNTVCALCGEGFVLSGGSCAKCGTNFAACAVCDPAAPSACLLCKSGFNMTPAGECVENKEHKPFQLAVTIEM